MDWDLPDEEATTVAGLVIHEAQTIPEPGQAFTFYGYRFEILRKSRNKITAIRIRRSRRGQRARRTPKATPWKPGELAIYRRLENRSAAPVSAVPSADLLVRRECLSASACTLPLSSAPAAC